MGFHLQTFKTFTKQLSSVVDSRNYKSHKSYALHVVLRTAGCFCPRCPRRISYFKGWVVAPVATGRAFLSLGVTKRTTPKVPRPTTALHWRKRRYKLLPWWRITVSTVWPVGTSWQHPQQVPFRSGENKWKQNCKMML